MNERALHKLDETIWALFDEFGAKLIIEALGKRVEEEAAIAHGETREIEARKWSYFARELKELADDLESDFFGA